MSRRFMLPLAFVLLALVAWQTQVLSTVSLETKSKRIELLSRREPLEQGVFPDKWDFGDDCGSELPFQVHAYNEDFYIIRQSKCETFEAPFLYLIFGEEKVLLLDTGANGSSPVQQTINRVIEQWLEREGRESIGLIVAHTHGHFDHVAGDNQFPGAPFVSDLVGASLNQAAPFWGFTTYPEDQTTIDLGNRVIDVLGTPGHHPASFSFYDRRTQLLLTADIVYPGHLFVFSQNDWPIFRESIDRLVDFAATHPVRWVVGCHVEMTDTPGEPYGYTTSVQPDEHMLQFKPTILSDVAAAAASLGATPSCSIFDEFVIHPVYLCGILWNG